MVVILNILIEIICFAGILYGGLLIIENLSLFFTAEKLSTNLESYQVSISGKKRSYLVYRPIVLPKETAVPLLIVLHGAIADAKKIMQYTQLNYFADEKQFVIVYPDMGGLFDWDVAAGLKSIDIFFMDQILDIVVKQENIDSRRIYATGYSSGGDLMHTFALSETLAPRIAAYAPVCSNLYKSVAHESKSKHPISILMISGTKDPFNPWHGNNQLLSVEQTLDYWKKHNQFIGEEKVIGYPKSKACSASSAQLLKWKNEHNQSEIALLKIANGGHTWPGTKPFAWATSQFMGETNQDVNANEAMWAFFEEHPLSEHS